MKTLPAARRFFAVTVAAALTYPLFLAAPAAQADTVPSDPTSAATPATVSADALPTVQINGVVWQQVVVGNTVYAAGDFTTAPPAGAAAGTNTATRSNILAYDVRTGALPDLIRTQPQWSGALIGRLPRR
jgi:hypothetical protein